MPTTNLVNRIRIPGLPQIIPLLTIMMEVFWSYTWLIWVSRVPALHWNAAPVNLLSCLVLAISIAVAVRLSLASSWSLKKVRWTIIPASFFLLFVLVRLNLGGGYAILDPSWFNYIGGKISQLVAVGIFGVLLIWRGINAGTQDNSFTVIYRGFIGGLVGIIMVLVVWRFGSGQISNIWQGIGLEILFFFGCGLLALAISNLERLRIELEQHQEATAAFSRRWVSMVVILVIAILGGGIILTGLLSQDTGASIVHFLGMLGNWLLTGFLYLLYPLGFLVQALLWVARYILALLRGNIPPPPPQNNLGDPNTLFQQAGEGELPRALMLALKWGSILIVSGLVIFFLSRLLSRYWKVKAEEGVEEVHETLASWKLFKMDLRSILGWFFRWLHRKPAASESDNDYLSPALEGEADKQYTIREMYRALLWEGRQSGTPRRASETPYEYNHRLQEHRENMSEELKTLTEAYVVERYGQVNPAPEKVNWLNQVWRSLRNKFSSKESDL